MRLFFLLLVILAVACTVIGENSEGVSFSAMEVKGNIENSQINEASGLTVSLNNPGMLWTHNDSGGGAFIFLLDATGKDKGTFELIGAKNRDWEDISSGPGPDQGKNYLYIGDIGDNNAVYDYYSIYRLEEPIAGSSDKITMFDTITFQYPDGSRDAEALMVDPKTRDLYIVSKREEQVGVYRAPYPQPTSDTLTLEKLGTLPYNNIVAGDISADGKEILLKTYQKVFYWRVKKGQSIFETLQTSPSETPYIPEPQGEALSWAKDQKGFFTVSEERDGIEAILYYIGKEE